MIPWKFLMMIALPAYVLAQSGLIHTPEEVAIWRDRAENGPFRVDGDAFTNSPGDWTRIKGNADALVSSVSQSLFKPLAFAANGCVARLNDTVGGQSITVNEPTDVRVRDAAFAYLITQDAKYLNAVRAALIAQINEPLTDFSNQSLWCYGYINDLNPGFSIAEWLQRLLLAYDFVKDDLAADDQLAIETWLYNAAVFMREGLIDYNLDQLYSDRENGVLSSLGISRGSSSTKRWTHHNGYHTYALPGWYNNRRAGIATYVAWAGVFFNDQTMKNSGKYFFKEWLMYSIHADGIFGEFHRSEGNSRTQAGFFYAYATLSSMIRIADIFARAGDDSLYKFSTSKGIGTTVGGNKDLLLPAKLLISLKNRERVIFSAGSNPLVAIEGREGSRVWAHETWLAQANRYWRDPGVKHAYLTTLTETTNIAGAGPFSQHMGNGGVYPGVLFMFGDMEDENWPYGGTPFLHLASQPLLSVAVAATYRTQLQATGGAPPYQWSVKPGSLLPPGLRIDTLSGLIHGVPETAGTYTFSIEVNDSDAGVAEQQFTIEVSGPDPGGDLAHYKFDHADEWGRESNGLHHGSTVGVPKRINGQVNDAILFTRGIEERLEIANLNYAPGGFTVSMWLKIDDNGGIAYQHIFNHGETGTLNSIAVYSIESGNRLQPGDRIRTEVRGASNSQSSGSLLDIAIDEFVGDGMWHHYVLVVDSTGSRVFWNGTRRRDSVHGANGVNPTGVISVGMPVDGNIDRGYAGGLDELRIFPRALSENEVMALHYSSVSRAPWRGAQTWKTSSWLGLIHDYSYPWIYHSRKGWIYIENQGSENFQLYREGGQWLWTREDAFPNVFSYAQQEWQLF